MQVTRKTVAKSLADGVVQLAIPGVYIMRISYDSATVNIFVFSGALAPEALLPGIVGK